MEQMIIANISLDILALLISMIPVVYLLNNQRFREKINLYFAGIGISNVFMIIGDLSDWLMREISSVQQYWALNAFSVLFYISSAFILYSFGKYVAEYLNLAQPKKIFFQL